MMDVGVMGMRMSEFDMFMQMAMRLARWVIWAVYVLMMLIVHMEMVVNKRFVNMKMGVSFSHKKQNASCHGT